MLTDKEIKEALHTACFSDLKNIFIRNYITGETTILNMDDILDLINRQHTEIERLKVENQSLKKAVNSLKGALREEQYCTNKVRKQINSAKTEAIKEFAELLCADRVLNDPVVIAVKCQLEEMVGEDCV